MSTEKVIAVVDVVKVGYVAVPCGATMHAGATANASAKVTVQVVAADPVVIFPTMSFPTIVGEPPQVESTGGLGSLLRT